MTLDTAIWQVYINDRNKNDNAWSFLQKNLLSYTTLTKEKL